MDPIQRARLQGHIDNTEELKKPELVIPPARDWDADGSNARRYATSVLTQTIATREPELDDRILYLGMTGSAAAELAALRSTGATVIAVEHQAKIGDREFDLSKPSQALAYAYTIGLKDDQAERVAQIITGNPELASIARVWASEHPPSRLVLSGHSAGSTVYGPTSSMAFKDLEALAAAMPRGASFVEDIHFSSCNTSLFAAADTERKTWTDAFPRLQTIWAYQNACPEAPGEHMKVWEHETRGRATTIHLSEALRQAHVTVSDRAGHVDGWAISKKLSELRADLADADRQFPDFFAGRGALTPASYTPIHDAYDTYQKALARNDIPASEKAVYRAKADQLVRLRYWSEMMPRFAEKYSAELSAAGFKPADFAKLSRADFMKLAPSTPLLRGLRDLDPTIVRQEWCRE